MTARAVALLAVAMIVACAMRTGPPAVVGADLIVLPLGAKRPNRAVPVFFVEVVATLEKRNLGLGGRRSLATDSGMLFVYGDEQRRTFWMKDCLIGLDIAFVAGDGRITNIATLAPGAGLPAPEIPRADSSAPARYVLETEAGWLGAHGVSSGDRLDLSAAIAGVVPR